jgi:hypothetical protein
MGPEDFRRIFRQSVQEDGKFVSHTHQPPLSQPHCELGVESTSNINKYQKSVLGVKAAGA